MGEEDRAQTEGERQDRSRQAAGGRQPFKGFAYTKNSSKPMVIYGNSQDEILGRLAETNSSLGAGEKYIKLSLGKYDAQTGDYGSYRRLDAMTGKDITSVYLELPRLPGEEFTRTVAYLKENGAKFNTHRKQWYTTPERAEQLQEYLAGLETGDGRPSRTGQDRSLPVRTATDRQEPGEQAGDYPEAGHGLPENVSRGLRMISTVGCTFTLKLRDGSTLDLDVDSFMSRLGGHLKLDVDMNSLIDEIAAEVDRKSRLVELDREHMVSVAGGTENRCTVCYTGPGKEQPNLVLDGGSLGVRFRDMDDREIRSMAADWLARDRGQERQYGIPEKEPAPDGTEGMGTGTGGKEPEAEVPGDAWKGRTVEDWDGEPLPSPGDTVTMYVPVYEPFRSGEIVTGVETVTGILTKISEDPTMEGHYLYTLENSEGDCCISTGDSYSPAQAAFLRGIAGSGIGKEEFDLVATPGLKLERMESVYRGVHEDGLVAGQAAYMAAPGLAGWQVEAWRVGMQNGLLCRDISSTLEYYEDDAEGCLKYLGTLATEHRQETVRDITGHGYKPSPVILARINRIRGMLQKDWKLSDICQAYRQRTCEQSRAGREIDSLAEEFRKQEIARKPPVQER